MSEALPPTVPDQALIPTEVKTLNPDKYKTLVVILTVLTTVITAIVAGLQADVNIRASISNRNSQVDAILVAGEIHRQGLQFAYDTNVFTSYLKDSQESLVMQITAYEQDQAGDAAGSAASLHQAEIAQARADTAQKFSIYYSDSRYAPTSSDGLPNMQAYLDDSNAAASDLMVRQNAGAKDYDKWNKKGDGYTSILAILAVAFFLFGLAQALTPKLRLLLAIFGMVSLLGAGVWTVIMLMA